MLLSFVVHPERTDDQVAYELGVLLVQEDALVLSQQEDALLDRSFEVQTLHLPFVLQVNILEVAELVSNFIGLRPLQVCLL